MISLMTKPDKTAPSPQALVMEFHETYGLAIRPRPQFDVPEREMRMGLIREEVEELEEAYANGDLVEMADAWADLVYVVYGAAMTHGVDLDDVLSEVQRSNMSKLGADGKPIYREDGKVMKGPAFTEPDIRRVLEGQGHQAEVNESAS